MYEEFKNANELTNQNPYLCLHLKKNIFIDKYDTNPNMLLRTRGLIGSWPKFGAAKL